MTTKQTNGWLPVRWMMLLFLYLFCVFLCVFSLILLCFCEHSKWQFILLSFWTVVLWGKWRLIIAFLLLWISLVVYQLVVVGLVRVMSPLMILMHYILLVLFEHLIGHFIIRIVIWYFHCWVTTRVTYEVKNFKKLTKLSTESTLFYLGVKETNIFTLIAYIKNSKNLNVST